MNATSHLFPFIYGLGKLTLGYLLIWVDLDC